MFERLPARPGPPGPSGYYDLVCPNDQCEGTIEPGGRRNTWTVAAAAVDRDPDRKCCSECGTEGVEQGTIDPWPDRPEYGENARTDALEALAIQYDTVKVRELSLGRARARCYENGPGGQVLAATYIVHPDGRTVGA